MSWKKVKLNQILKQYRIEIQVQNDIEYKQVTISKYDGVTSRGTKIGKDIGRKRQFKIDLKKYPNTLMFVRQGVQDGSIGIAPLDVDGCIVTENMPMFSIENINMEYLKLLLKSPYFFDELNKIQTTGSAQKSIHEREILEIEIPLPNFKEQGDIVSQLTEIKDKSNEISSELSYQISIVKKLRQQLMQDSLEGKIVEQNLREESAIELLKTSKELKKKLIKEKKLKLEKELPPIEPNLIPFELPQGWVWCKIDELVISQREDIRTGPFGTALHKNEHRKDGVPVWGIESISKDGRFTGKNKIFVSNEKAKELSSFSVNGGDLIISRSGTIGELCMLPNDIQYGLLSTNLMKISVNKKVILPAYFCHIIKGGGYIKKMLEEYCSGSTRLFITQKILSKLIFPLPPFFEQKRIVEKLDELMNHCDELEQNIKQNILLNEKLFQQVLREALRK